MGEQCSEHTLASTARYATRKYNKSAIYLIADHLNLFCFVSYKDAFIHMRKKC